MKFALFLLFLVIGCVPAVRFDITCVGRLDIGGTIVINCADNETWKEWQKKQMNVKPTNDQAGTIGSPR